MNAASPPPRRSVEYTHVDVFAEAPYRGNSLPVFVDPGDLDDAQLLAITQELHHFEAIFLAPTPDPSTWRARVFDQVGELAFAGHPVLGAAAVLHARCRDGDRAKKHRWRVILPGRAVTVTTCPAESGTGGGYLADLDQGEPDFGLQVRDRARVAGAFGLDATDLRGDLPLRVVSTGLRYLVVPVRAGALARARVVEDLTALVESAGAEFAVLLDDAALEVRHWSNDGHSEDVATGSAAGVIGAYRLHYGLTADGEAFALHQGRFVGRPSVLRVCAHGTAPRVDRVTVSGAVAAVGHGAVLVP